MKILKLKTALVCLALAGSCLLTGCQSGKDGKISIGLVDTAELLKEDAQYQSLSVEYLKERQEFQKNFQEKAKKVDQDNKDQMAKLKEEYIKSQGEFDTKWKKKTDDFQINRQESLRSIAAEIAGRKNIDLIIVNSEDYHTREWGGVDITPDVALALSSGAGDAKPAASASPEEAKK